MFPSLPLRCLTPSRVSLRLAPTLRPYRITPCIGLSAITPTRKSERCNPSVFMTKRPKSGSVGSGADFDAALLSSGARKPAGMIFYFAPGFKMSVSAVSAVVYVYGASLDLFCIKLFRHIKCGDIDISECKRRRASFASTWPWRFVEEMNC